jgi:hypothetical protein
MRSILTGIAILFGAGGAGCWSSSDPKAAPDHKATEPAAGKPRTETWNVANKVKIAKLAVDQFAFQSFPMWSVANPNTCPDSLVTIAKYVGKTEEDTLDPWGTPLKMFCGTANLPPGVHGVGVLSFGPDKKEGTADDIKSWQSLEQSAP